MSYEGYTTSPLYIYKPYAFQSGYSKSTTYGSVSNITTSSYDNGLYFVFSSGMRINQVINLTNYNYLKIRLKYMYAQPGNKITTTALLGISTKSNLTSSGFDKTVTKSITNGNTLSNYDMILDIRSISGNYYIYITSSYTDDNKGTLYVDQIWLENQ